MARSCIAAGVARRWVGLSDDDHQLTAPKIGAAAVVLVEPFRGVLAGDAEVVGSAWAAAADGARPTTLPRPRSLIQAVRSALIAVFLPAPAGPTRRSTWRPERETLSTACRCWTVSETVSRPPARPATLTDTVAQSPSRRAPTIAPRRRALRSRSTSHRAAGGTGSCRPRAGTGRAEGELRRRQDYGARLGRVHDEADDGLAVFGRREPQIHRLLRRLGHQVPVRPHGPLHRDRRDHLAPIASIAASGTSCVVRNSPSWPITDCDHPVGSLPNRWATRCRQPAVRSASDRISFGGRVASVAWARSSTMVLADGIRPCRATYSAMSSSFLGSISRVRLELGDQLVGDTGELPSGLRSGPRCRSSQSMPRSRDSRPARRAS